MGKTERQYKCCSFWHRHCHIQESADRLCVTGNSKLRGRLSIKGKVRYCAVEFWRVKCCRYTNCIVLLLGVIKESLEFTETCDLQGHCLSTSWRSIYLSSVKLQKIQCIAWGSMSTDQTAGWLLIKGKVRCYAIGFRRVKWCRYANCIVRCKALFIDLMTNKLTVFGKTSRNFDKLNADSIGIDQTTGRVYVRAKHPLNNSNLHYI